MIEARTAEQDRWQELAALLGLPPEGQMPPPAKAAPRPTAEPPPSPKPQAPPPEEDEGLAYPVEIASASLEIADEWVEEAAPPAEPVQAEDDQRDGRRRRGRGSRRPREDNDAPAGKMVHPDRPGLEPNEAEPAAPQERRSSQEGTDEEGDRPRRGRKRGRKPTRRDDDAPAQAEPPSQDLPLAEDVDDDDLPHAKWNLPSWDELIGSLKRP